MARIAALVYGVVCYLIFFVTFLYAIAFVGNLFVPRSIDINPQAATLTRAIIANVILLSIFALQQGSLFLRTRKRPRALRRADGVPDPVVLWTWNYDRSTHQGPTDLLTGQSVIHRCKL